MPKIVVEGPDGKKYAFPDTMPREQINTFMKERYGTKARNETVNDYLARVVREQDATKARAKSVTKEATAAGRAEGERAAERMGVDNAFEMAMAAPAIGMAQQAGARPVFDREGTMLPDEAAGLAALNTAGFFIPGMVNERFGQRVEEGRRQQPGFAFAGDVAGGMIGGELIGLGLQKAGQAIAPGVSAIGRLFKGKPAAAPAAAAEPPMVLGPQNRILPVDRPDAFPGDDVEMARALDDWTPPPEQQVRPMGFGVPRNSDKRVSGFFDEMERGAEPFYDERLGSEGSSWNKIVEMAKNGFSNDEIVEETGLSPGSIRQYLSRARSLGIDVKKASPPGRPTETGTIEDILRLKKRGLSPAQISNILGKPRNTVNVMLRKERERLKAANEQIPDWLATARANGLLTERGRDAVEQTFGAAYMSGTGSVAGGQYDLNGDGEIDNTDLAIGSGIGLAAFASPLALRKVAELGGRLKGTKAQGMASKPPETPQQAARFETPGSPEYEAAVAKGLDMSTPARMARAQAAGYNTDEVLYHGTASNVQSFDPQKAGSSTRARSAKMGTWLTGSPRTAEGYADVASETPVRDLLEAAEKAERNREWDVAEKLTRQAEELEAAGGRGQSIMPLYVRGKLKTVDMDGVQYDPDDVNLSKIAETAKREGFDGIRLTNFSDEASYGQYNPTTHVLVFDPSNIRSVNAAFDPDKAASPILTAGFAAPAGSGKRASGFLDDLERGTNTFFDERLGAQGSNWNKAVEMARNGYSNDEIAEAIGWTPDSTKEMLKRARNLGIDVPKGFVPGGVAQTTTGTTKDILALKQQGLTTRQISERTGKPGGTISSMLSQERARLRKAGEEIPDWLAPEFTAKEAN